MHTSNGPGASPAAILLDAAGTLIKPSRPVGETYAGMAGRYGANLDAGALAQAFREEFRDMPDLAFAWTTVDELRRLEHAWWHSLVWRVVARTGTAVSDFDAFFGALYGYYSEGDAWECFPEVPDVLQQLRARGCKLAVVSNFDSRLPGILDALGIHRQLDAIIYSSKAGSAKPHPHIFKRALAWLDVEPEAAIHVGDSEAADVGGAVAAGLTGVLIDRGAVPASGSAGIIRSLDELLVRF